MADYNNDLSDGDKNNSQINRLFFYSFSVIFLLGTASLLFPFIPLDTNTRLLISDIQAPIISLGTSAALFMAAYRSRKYAPVLTRGWFFLGLAQVAYFLGDFLWFILEAVLQETPYPSVADIPYLLYYPLIFIAFFLFPIRKYHSTDWLKRLLDLLSILVGGVAIYLNYILGPILQESAGLGFWDQILAYAYPIGDLILLGAILLLYYNRMNERNGAPMSLVSLGILIMVIADSAFSIQSLEDTYVSGGLTDAGYVLQNLIVSAAALWQIMLLRKVLHTERVANSVLDLMNGLFSYLPLLWFSGLLAMLYDSHMRALPMTFTQVFVVCVVVFLIVLIRQVITNYDLAQSFRQINEYVNTVKQQSDDLETINANLEEEMAMREEANRERARIEEQRIHDALHDQLTRLPNRALFVDRLESALMRTRRLSDIKYSVLILDLDEFKQINDTEGHNIGDELLKLVAERLKTCIRENDTISRLGGDEFAILLENPQDIKVVQSICNEKIFIKLKEPFEVAGKKYYISVSIGVVEDVSTFSNTTDILQAADIAMYHAKESGKSRSVLFIPEMRNQTIQRVMIENELRYAIELREFKLNYQPIISLETDELIGFEALLRWNNPRMGSVPPGVFIPVAEDTGLIIEIGDWVLYQACRQMKKWHDVYPDLAHLSISVNISTLQFMHPDFIESLKNVIRSTRIDPKKLKLEITESVLMDGQDAKTKLFRELRELGINLQIDDFGTGYSSLSYLQHIPVDVIKIDRSFVKELGSNSKYVELLNAIIRMAQSLGMQTTAEGIETSEQLELLKALGCDYGQGYLFSKPVEPEKAETDVLKKGIV